MSYVGCGPGSGRVEDIGGTVVGYGDGSGYR